MGFEKDKRGLRKAMSIKKHLFMRLSRSNVKKQLVTVFLLAILLPVTIISGIILNTFRSKTYQQYVDLLNSDNQRVESIFFNATSRFYNLSEQLLVDKGLTTLLETQYSTPEQSAAACDQYGNFKNVFFNDTAISSICVYTSNSSIAPSTHFQQATAAVQKTAWFQKAASSYYPFWQVCARKDSFGNPLYEVTLYRHFTLVKTHSYAVLAISMSNNFLHNQLENNTLCSAVSVNSEPVFYSSWSDLVMQKCPVTLQAGHFYQKENAENIIDGRRCLTSTSTLLPYHTDDSFYIVSMNSTALDEIDHLTQMLLLLLLAIMAVSCIIIFLFTHYFSVRVECLRSAMHRACNNDYNIIDDFHGNDELSDTFRDLQGLVEQVKVKEAKMYREQLREQKLENEQQKMEYELLANQINPHFLYNTLETIRMKALTEGNRDVATAIKLLGKSMRYVLENTGTSSTTLKRELDYISVYLQIQKLRFGDKFNYTLHTAPEIDPAKCEILPLLLQPIIENCISHGFSDISEGGLIDLDVRLLGSSVLSLTVSDNGAGMTNEEVKALRRSILTSSKEKSRHIGLCNINQRILLCYGECYGIEIESKPGSGTKVNLTIPYHTI